MNPRTINILGLVILAAFVVLALTGCASTPQRRGGGQGGGAEVFTPASSGSRAKPSPSAATITIIHIRPEARDYVHP